MAEKKPTELDDEADVERRSWTEGDLRTGEAPELEVGDEE